MSLATNGAAPAAGIVQALAMDLAASTAAGVVEILDAAPAPGAPADIPLSVRVDEGAFVPLAKSLFIMNGHRRGPLRGGYVVLETEPGKTWCVGQLRADAATPLRLFRSLAFASEAEARHEAEALRRADLDRR